MATKQVEGMAEFLNQERWLKGKGHTRASAKKLSKKEQDKLAKEYFNYRNKIGTNNMGVDNKVLAAFTVKANVNPDGTPESINTVYHKTAERAKDPVQMHKMLYNYHKDEGAKHNKIREGTKFASPERKEHNDKAHYHNIMAKAHWAAHKNFR